MTALNDLSPIVKNGSSSGITSPSLDRSAMPRTISEIIRARLDAAKVPYLANDNVAEHLQEGELDLLQKEVADRMRYLLRSLVIDIDNDHNTQETA